MHNSLDNGSLSRRKLLSANSSTTFCPRAERFVLLFVTSRRITRTAQPCNRKALTNTLGILNMFPMNFKSDLLYIKFGYQYTCPLPAHLSFFRHVELLLNSIKKMDVQYDECNTAMAQGEVNGFDMKLPSWKKYVKRIYCYIVQFFLVGPATEFFQPCMRHWFLQLRNITAMEFLDVFPYPSGIFVDPRFVSDATAKMKTATYV